MSDIYSRVMEHTEDGALDGVHLYEGEYVAVIRYNEGHDSRSSYLTRDFLEAVKDTSPLYYYAAGELAKETLNSFAHTVINQEEEGFLAHRMVTKDLHGFSFHPSRRKISKEGMTEYLLTQDEVDKLHEEANGQITEWLHEERMESQRAKEAANHNLGMLYVLATAPDGP